MAIMGAGHAGPVPGALLSGSGHTATCVDVDRARINALKEGVNPIC
ncbi:MAG: UDP-glucose 6-dehydrogenase YwqF [Firmicutes bacterium ADurb.Bin456]|nr:MAG: UDP-glucose 6-dehydrogenase YwqF [Firmicutes bacterium ADurb.Bin456]